MPEPEYIDCPRCMFRCKSKYALKSHRSYCPGNSEPRRYVPASHRVERYQTFVEPYRPAVREDV